MKRTPLQRRTELKRTGLLNSTVPHDVEERPAKRGPGARRNGDAPPQSYKVKPCPICGSPFQPWSGNQKYCSPNCSQKSEETDRVCKHCGETYRRAGPKTQFCSFACRDAERDDRLAEVICPACNQAFKKRRWNQKYCSKRCGQNTRWLGHKRKGLPSPSVWSLRLKGEDECRSCGAPAQHLHHIVPRSKSRHGKLDYERNGLPLCAPCHRGWHDRVVTIHSDCLRLEELKFARQNAGVVWVERNYPDRSLEDDPWLTGERWRTEDAV